MMGRQIAMLLAGRPNPRPALPPGFEHLHLSLSPPTLQPAALSMTEAAPAPAASAPATSAPDSACQPQQAAAAAHAFGGSQGSCHPAGGQQRPRRGRGPRLRGPGSRGVPFDGAQQAPSQPLRHRRAAAAAAAAGLQGRAEARGA